MNKNFGEKFTSKKILTYYYPIAYNPAKMSCFISREDQLGLMRDSLAVVQPSLFEGWGTVVEDAKTLGVQVLCSDIEIHHEENELIVGTHGRGIYRTNLEPIREAFSNDLSTKGRDYFFSVPNAKIIRFKL